MTKFEQLLELEGMDEDEYLAVYGLESVVPGICMNAGCEYTTHVEPDCTKGWCEECRTQSVQSGNSLLGDHLSETVNMKTPVVDALGDLKAEISKLTKKEKELREQLVAVGEKEYDGLKFRATVSVSEVESLDTAALKKSWLRFFLKRFMKTSHRTSVNVVALKRTP